MPAELDGALDEAFAGGHGGAGFEAVDAITSFGDLPMTVITAAHREDPALAPAELARLDAAWAVGVQRWAALSPSATIVTVDDTGHHIEVDQPALVIDQVLNLLP